MAQPTCGFYRALPLSASAATDLTPRLPAPTGNWHVGTTTRALVDPDRSDPWNG
jgi:N-methylhydantoinase B/oxoprolinase/acetone carboxylase alpha subunit